MIDIVPRPRCVPRRPPACRSPWLSRIVVRLLFHDLGAFGDHDVSVARSTSSRLRMQGNGDQASRRRPGGDRKLDLR